MIAIPKLVCTAAVSAMVLSGCAVAPENAFPEARSVGECQGQYQAAKRQTRQAVSGARASSRDAGLLGSALLGVLGGASESNDRTKLLVCMQRVGATEEEFRAAVGSSRTVPMTQGGGESGSETPIVRSGFNAPVSTCPKGSAVMRGGSQYCVGLK